jgi:hypothetical protein
MTGCCSGHNATLPAGKWWHLLMFAAFFLKELEMQFDLN